MKLLGPFAAILFASVSSAQPLDLAGNPRNPFANAARVRILLFVRTDCPITNRYAPELQRLGGKFAGPGVEFWLVYPDRTSTPTAIKEHIAEYHFPGEPLRDPRHELVKRAHATITPEAAVFDASGRLVYHGRIDDRWVEIGKARAEARTHDLEDSIAAVLAGKAVARAETRAVGCTLADLE
jgi:hypothetical protein